MAKNKRDLIAELIEAGGATKEALMEAADVNSAGLASQFTYLRLTGKYPVKGDNGIFKFVTEAEWDEMKSAAANRTSATKAKKSPEERKEALDKRIAKLQEACAKREEAAAKNPSAINKLRLQKAVIEIDIANFEMDALAAGEDEDDE